VGWAAFLFFMGDLDELTLAMPDPADFVVKERERGRAQNQDLANVLRTIQKKKPEVRAPQPTQPKPDTLPPPSGGPLGGEWEVLSVYTAAGRDFASLGKSTQTTVSTGRPTSARPTRSTRPVRRRSSARATPKTGGAKTTYVVAGQSFTIDGKAYDCEKIEFSPPRVVYRDGSRLFVLEQPEDESPIVIANGILELNGKPSDGEESSGSDDEIDNRGEIEMPDPDAKDSGTKEADAKDSDAKEEAAKEEEAKDGDDEKSAAAQPARPAPRVRDRRPQPQPTKRDLDELQKSLDKMDKKDSEAVREVLKGRGKQ
ncbi:MAG: hypothetical protein KDC38_18080, partial [Planctomycetes bacterium]|nr:hypothetical protein [Planctomycetota bacterium]